MSTIALLLIDFQNDYFSSYNGAKWALSGTEKASLNAATLLTQFRLQKLPVIHVRHEFPSDDAPFFYLHLKVQKFTIVLHPLKAKLLF